MRGVIGIDVLIGLLLLMSVAASLLPNWDAFKAAAETSLCTYYNDISTYVSHLGQELNASVDTPSLDISEVNCP